MQEHEAGQEWGVPLGVDSGGRLIRSFPFRPLLIAVGEPRSGKTRLVMMPILMWWVASALVVSVRADLMRLTRRARALRGRVLVWDPSGLLRGAEAEETVAFDLLALCRTWEGARDVAARLAAAAPTSNIQEQSFWVGRAQALLAAHLLAAALGDLTLKDVLRFSHLRDQWEPKILLGAAAEEQDVEEARHLLDAWEAADDKVAQSIALTEDQILGVFENPAALRAVSGTVDFARELERPGTTIFVVAPATKQAQYAPILSIVIDHVLTTAIERHTATEEAQRLLVIVDEAAQVRLQSLPEVTAVAAGCGVMLATAWHNPGQLAMYGANAATVISNSENLLFLPGRDPEAARLLDDLIGDDLHQSLRGRGRGIALLRGIPPGHAVLVKGRALPELVRLLDPALDPDLAFELQRGPEASPELS